MDGKKQESISAWIVLWCCDFKNCFDQVRGECAHVHLATKNLHWVSKGKGVWLGLGFGLRNELFCFDWAWSRLNQQTNISCLFFIALQICWTKDFTDVLSVCWNSWTIELLLHGFLRCLAPTKHTKKRGGWHNKTKQLAFF